MRMTYSVKFYLISEVLKIAFSDTAFVNREGVFINLVFYFSINDNDILHSLSTY